MLLAKDDLLLDGLILGANSGVGGTYNHCFSLYMKIIEAYSMNKLKVCRQLQYQSKLFYDLLERYRGNTMAGKRIMKFLGMDFGPNRLPLQSISDQEEIELKRDLEAIGFFSYCNH
jgi:N-acetylneuraminate lyase